MTPLQTPTAASVTNLLAQRRSIRRLAGGALSPETVSRLQEAVVSTPSAFGVTPWHVVILQEHRQAFWDEVAEAFREGLDGDRLERYLGRLEGFRSGAGVILIYEDLAARSLLHQNWGLSEQTAHDFVQQGLGMLQLAIWLVLTEDGLVSSLQHWDWLIQDRVSALLALPTESYKLISVLPVGEPAEPVRDTPPVDPTQVLRIDPDLQRATRP